jgi:hypothetical protein
MIGMTRPAIRRSVAGNGDSSRIPSPLLSSPAAPRSARGSAHSYSRAPQDAE